MIFVAFVGVVNRRHIDVRFRRLPPDGGDNLRQVGGHVLYARLQLGLEFVLLSAADSAPTSRFRSLRTSSSADVSPPVIAS